ncbi:MAG: hypothetical protein ABI647_02945 [Gemmatimonadota bacterium]
MNSEQPSTISSTRYESARAAVRVGDVVTRYLRAGVGRPVLLLRGSQEPDLFWSGLAAGLAERVRVIVPELSEPFADFSGWLLAFLEGLGLHSVGVVAEDAAGLAAIAFALAEPDRIQQIVLLTVASSEPADNDPGFGEPLAPRGLAVPLLIVPRDAADLLGQVTRFLTAGPGPASPP